MRTVVVVVALVAAIGLFAAAPGRAQIAQPALPPAPAENLAAARELIQTMHATDQFKLILPRLFQDLKAGIVQNRPEVEKQYDAMAPIFNQKAQQRVNDLAEVMANIYANNFTVEELHDMTHFFQSPTGQKYIQRQATVAQQTLAAGQKLGREIAKDVQEQMSGGAN